MKRFKGIYVALIVSMIIMGAISACGGGGGGGNTPVATGEVTGKILDSMGDPIVGAEVTINSTPVTVFTDIAGAFWAEVEVGSHTITISMGTYTIYQGIFTLFGESGIYLGDLDPTNPYYSNGMTWYKDSDGDLYSSGDSEFADAPSNGYVLAGGLIAITGDCDDTNSAVNPGARGVQRHRRQLCGRYR